MSRKEATKKNVAKTKRRSGQTPIRQTGRPAAQGVSNLASLVTQRGLEKTNLGSGGLLRLQRSLSNRMNGSLHFYSFRATGRERGEMFMRIERYLAKPAI
jgi:hypothetical protein